MDSGDRMEIQDFLVGLIIVLVILAIMLVFSSGLVPGAEQALSNAKCLLFKTCG